VGLGGSAVGTALGPSLATSVGLGPKLGSGLSVAIGDGEPVAGGLAMIGLPQAPATRATAIRIANLFDWPGPRRFFTWTFWALADPTRARADPVPRGSFGCDREDFRRGSLLVIHLTAGWLALRLGLTRRAMLAAR
jgi:hypothetical protein